jgi:ubiquinone/menaquinone biosynthesis C-methylase UbiE
MNASITFDRAADYYDQTRGYPPGVEKGVASIIAQAGNLKADSRVLEIGIGTGRIALPVAPLVGSYYGIDLSRPMMNRLRAKQYSEAIFVAEGDATQLPFPTGTFDAVVAVHVFHLIPNWRDALAEVRRVLRPGGMLVHCWSKDSQNDVFRPLWDVWNTAIGEKTETHFGPPWQVSSLGDEGWHPAGETFTHDYPTETSVTIFLDLLRARVWSSCWRYTDDELARGTAAIESVIPTLFADPQTTINRTTTVFALAHLPPQ